MDGNARFDFSVCRVADSCFFRCLRNNMTIKPGIPRAHANDPTTIPAIAPLDRLLSPELTRIYFRLNTVSVMTLTSEPEAEVAGR